MKRRQSEKHRAREREAQKYAAAAAAAAAEHSNFEHFTLAFSNYTKAERKQRAKQEQQKTREHGTHTHARILNVQSSPREKKSEMASAHLRTAQGIEQRKLNKAAQWVDVSN